MVRKPYWLNLSDGLKYQPALVFEGGILHINGKGYGDRDGAGTLTIKESDLHFPIHPEDEGYRILQLPRSELDAIRKHINECIGPYADDATENPRVVDNDNDEITVTLGGREIRGWSYASDDERRQKVQQARDYVEGWCDALETAKAST
jgi:hypothetical protein